MKVVYIAGPFRAPTPWIQELHVRRAEALALEVWCAGHVALCPHTMCRHYQGSADDAVWLEGTLELLRRADAVLLVDGWRGSVGTAGEIAEASRLGIPVYLEVEDIQ